MTTPLPEPIVKLHGKHKNGRLSSESMDFYSAEQMREYAKACGAAEYKRGQAEKLKLTDDQIEALAVQHEAFGFGLVDAKGYTTHGFDPDGLSAFVRELLGETS